MQSENAVEKKKQDVNECDELKKAEATVQQEEKQELDYKVHEVDQKVLEKQDCYMKRKEIYKVQDVETYQMDCMRENVDSKGHVVI